MPHRARTLAWLLCAVALTATGCGLFSTRAPESPFLGGGIHTTFTAPESTLATLALAVHARSQSVYGLCLADTSIEGHDFHATFDPADLIAFQQSGGTPPLDWTRSSELTFFPQFLSYLTNAPYDVYFMLDTGPGSILDVGGPTAKKIYNEHYRVWAAGSPVCAGAAYLSFERVGAAGEYRLTYWEDRRDTTNVRTWGTARLVGK
jgi:hypothetical protein